MQLIISVCENYLSQPKWTTLVFVLKLDLSEYHIKMSFFNILTMSRHILYLMEASWDVVFLIVMSKFPNYWVFFKNRFACWILKKGQIGREVGFFHLKYVTIIMVVCVFKQDVSADSTLDAVPIVLNALISRMYVAPIFVWFQLIRCC